MSLGGCPSCTPNQRIPHLAQTNSFQLVFNRQTQMQWQEVPKHPSFSPPSQNLFALDQVILPLKIQIHWIPLCPSRVYCLLEPAAMLWSCLCMRFTSTTVRKLLPCHILDLIHSGGKPHLVTEFFWSPGWMTLSLGCAVLLDAGEESCGSTPRNQPETLSAVPLYNLISLIHSSLKEKKKPTTSA